MYVAVHNGRPWMKRQKSNYKKNHCLIWLKYIASIMTSTLTVKEKMKMFSHINAPGIKLVVFVKKVNANIGPSFVQTRETPHPQCHIPSPKLMGLLVLEKI